ncbi:MAG: hypothetical protein ACUVUS_01145 [Thermoproteota archaeon]
MQKKEAIYSVGNLLILIGIISSAVFMLLPSLMEVSGLTRTGVNLANSLLIFAGTVLPILLKDMDIGQRMKSMGIRCFTSSFILSILLIAQLLSRGWASKVPTLASVALALSGIVAYLLSGKGGKAVLPHLREALLLISVVTIFTTPMIQLSLPRLGLSVDIARVISISLLIVFTIVLYFSLKMLKGEVGPA